MVLEISALNRSRSFFNCFTIPDQFAIFAPQTIELGLQPEFIVCNVVRNTVAVLERVPYFESRADAVGATVPIFLATTLVAS